MISLSDAARKELDAFFSGNPDAKKSVRVFPAPGGCCGPTLSMALDDADDNDVSEEIGGVTYCMTKELYEAIGNISVDLSYLGFAIVSERPVPDMGGSCSCGGGFRMRRRMPLAFCFPIRTVPQRRRGTVYSSLFKGVMPNVYCYA